MYGSSLPCTATILGDAGTGEAVVVDPGGDAAAVEAALKERGLTNVTLILITHAHLTSFVAAFELKRAFPAAKVPPPLAAGGGGSGVGSSLNLCRSVVAAAGCSFVPGRTARRRSLALARL